MIVDVFTIEELRGKETAKQYFVEHVLELYQRNPITLAILLGQLKNDEFFSDEEAHILTMEVVEQNSIEESEIAVSNDLSNEDQQFPEEMSLQNDFANGEKTSALTDPVDRTNNSSRKSEIAMGVVSSLLAIALIAAAVMGYFLYDLSDQLYVSQRNTTIKENKVHILNVQLKNIGICFRFSKMAWPHYFIWRGCAAVTA